MNQFNVHILVGDYTIQLGGGNSNIFGIFIPKIGEDEPGLSPFQFPLHFPRTWVHYKWVLYGRIQKFDVHIFQMG